MLNVKTSLYQNKKNEINNTLRNVSFGFSLFYSILYVLSWACLNVTGALNVYADVYLGC
jgi:hypothetical protein